MRELLYADGAATVFQSVEEMQDLCNASTTACPELGMSIIRRKSLLFYMHVVSNPPAIKIH